MLELWLIRHGETQWNRDGKIQGFSDVPLNRLGRLQAERLAERIASETFDLVYASDLRRAFETASIALPGRDITREPRLREINLGKYEGRLAAEMNAEERDEFAVWFKGPYQQRVPEGESNDDLRDRLKTWMSELPGTGRAIAFSHGGAIANLLQIVTGRPPAQSAQGPNGWGFRLHNTGISRLSFHDTHTLIESVNDAAHIETLVLD